MAIAIEKKRNFPLKDTAVDLVINIKDRIYNVFNFREKSELTEKETLSTATELEEVTKQVSRVMYISGVKRLFALSCITCLAIMSISCNVAPETKAVAPTPEKASTTMPAPATLTPIPTSTATIQLNENSIYPACLKSNVGELNLRDAPDFFGGNEIGVLKNGEVMRRVQPDKITIDQVRDEQIHFYELIGPNGEQVYAAAMIQKQNRQGDPYWQHLALLDRCDRFYASFNSN